MMKKKQFCLIGMAVSLGVASHANAALLGVTRTYPDVTLNNTYLIYDHDALKTYKNGACSSNTVSNACIGQLTLVSFGSTLNAEAGSGSPTATQLYAGGGGNDSTPDKMMTIAIQSTGSSSTLGNWAASTNNTSANKVTITQGTTPTDVDKFSWSGDVTNFGWLADSSSSSAYYELGTQFDGLWKMTSDTYVNMPAGMSQFVNGVLTSAMAAFDGGFKISNSAGFTQDGNPNNTASSNKVSLANALKRDWVFGSGANTASVKAMLAPYLTGLSTTNCSSNTSTNCVKYLNSTVMADVFVPIPPAFLLWAGALTAIIPSVKRIKTSNMLRSA